MGLRKGDKVVSFDDVKVLRETDAALLCEIEGQEHWIPKSQLSDDSEVFDADDNNSGTLVVSDWIARQKNLV